MTLVSQMTYRGPPKLGKTKDRLAEAHNRLRKLQQMPHDVIAKIHMVNMWEFIPRHFMPPP